MSPPHLSVPVRIFVPFPPQSRTSEQKERATDAASLAPGGRSAQEMKHLITAAGDGDSMLAVVSRKEALIVREGARVKGPAIEYTV